MVTVRMKTHITGTRNGVRWPAPGGTVELPSGEANDLIAAGLAEAVPDEPKTEKRPAARKGVETRKA